MKTSARSLKRPFVMLVTLLAILIGISLVAAQQWNFPDGRLNQIAFFGGDALYCVDANYRVTDNYLVMIQGGGFRLLNTNGQELWFVPAAEVTKAADQTSAGGIPVPVGKGQGSYGESVLYVTKALDGTVTFVYTGFDEHGKANSFQFRLCQPRGSATLFSDEDSGSSPIVPPPKGTQEVT